MAHPTRLKERMHRIWARRWAIEPRFDTLIITWPKSGEKTGNLFYGPDATGGMETVTFTNGLGGWKLDYVGRDGYRTEESANGSIVLLNSEYSIPDANGDPAPLSSDRMLALCHKSGVKAAFNGQAVTITGVEGDEYATATVVKFSIIK